jgi:hypothetical protein
MSASKPTTHIDVEYREIARFPGFRFGDDGSCWTQWEMVCPGYGGGSTLVLTDTWTPRRSYIDGKGYRWVSLKEVDRPGTHLFQLHRLVMEAFKGPCPPGQETCHAEGKGVARSSCRLEDLRWDTSEANHAGRFEDGTDFHGEQNPSAKLTWEKVDEIRELHRQGVGLTALGNRFGVTRGMIWRICTGKSWTRRH